MSGSTTPELLNVVSHTPVEVENASGYAEGGGFVRRSSAFRAAHGTLYTWWGGEATERREWERLEPRGRLDHIWVRHPPQRAGRARVHRRSRGGMIEPTICACHVWTIGNDASVECGSGRATRPGGGQRYRLQSAAPATAGSLAVLLSGRSSGGINGASVDVRVARAASPGRGRNERARSDPEQIAAH